MPHAHHDRPESDSSDPDSDLEGSLPPLPPAPWRLPRNRPGTTTTPSGLPLYL